MLDLHTQKQIHLPETIKTERANRETWIKLLSIFGSTIWSLKTAKQTKRVILLIHLVKQMHIFIYHLSPP